MSGQQKLTKKQKKALAFRDRKGKGKPQSFDDLDDVPVDENQDRAEVELGAEVDAVEAPAGRKAGAKKGAAQDAEALGDGDRGKGKKRKREEKPEGDEEAKEDGAGEKKTKKKRKGADGAGVAAGDAVEEGKKEGKKAQGKQRFILFVGNLKYTTTKEAVEKHFAKCDPPPTVRLMTPKPSATSRPTAKSKGFAFVEFSHRNALQQGLKLHQSDIEGRKINVELTAGGGGKSENRLEKVKKRNRELHEQRQQIVAKKPRTVGEGEAQVERPQRYSTTSGVEQQPSKERTWSIPEAGDDGSKRKRGSKKKTERTPRPQGTGVNAIPVG